MKSEKKLKPRKTKISFKIIKTHRKRTEIEVIKIQTLKRGEVKIGKIKIEALETEIVVIKKIETQAADEKIVVKAQRGGLKSKKIKRTFLRKKQKEKRLIRD